MADVRRATFDDLDLVASIGAEGFYDDPVLSWVFPDPASRHQRLALVFAGLAGDFLADRGEVYVVDDACAAFWRDPSFEHTTVTADRIEADHPSEAPTESPFADDEVMRLRILGDVMTANHPHDPHWYLNVLSTRPPRQSQGLGARVLQPVLAECDASGTAAYLESSNPRNMTLYRRHGFVETRELELPDGPSLYAMWREPVPR